MRGIALQQELKPLRQLRFTQLTYTHKQTQLPWTRLHRERADLAVGVDGHEETTVRHHGLGVVTGAVQPGGEEREVEMEPVEEKQSFSKRDRGPLDGTQLPKPPVRGEEGEGGGRHAATLLQAAEAELLERRQMVCAECLVQLNDVERVHRRQNLQVLLH